MKKVVIVLLFILCISTIWAEIVEESVASSLALKFFDYVNKGSANLSSIKGYPFSDAHQPDLYIVSFEPAGFVLIAADDRSEPILGYDVNSLFPLDSLPEHVDWYLSQYSRSMAEIREHPEWKKDPKWQRLMNLDFSDYDFTRNVAPLCHTTWDQNWPYNAMCPEDSDGPGGRVYAGCVATAMAQVMKRWNHPHQGQGSGMHYTADYGLLTADFGNTIYNWQEMPNNLTQENSAVATLIYHCGVAVDMQYSPNGSGAYSSDARNALVSNFRYHNSAELIYAHDYTATTWANKMRAELDLSRPMVYRGQGDDGGHAFVLDGYQGTNYFHFNWGWSGHHDGYYYLNNLNPGSYTFTDYQGAITSLYPVIEYQNDLAATSISGNQTPMVGEQNSYQIDIMNMGQNYQSSYTVQLYRDNGILINSIDDGYIMPGETLTYTLNWTPDAGGSHTLYGKVILSSDQNPNNDITNILEIQVIPEDSVVLQIGHGTSSNSTTNAHTPYGTWYKAFRQQYLLLASELTDAGATAGNFAALGFNVENVNNCSAMPNYCIRLKQTALSSISGSFEAGNYQTVCEYDQFMPTDGWNTHLFQAPFVWDGQSNIIVDITTDMIHGSYTQNASVYYTSTTHNSCLRFQSDSANGMDGTSGTASNNRANIRLLYVPAGSEPMLSVTPDVLDFGEVILGVNAIVGSVNASNVGGGNLVLNAGNLSFAGAHADMFSYGDIVLPITLGCGESFAIPLLVNATTVGQISANFLVSYEGNTHEVELIGSCYDPVIRQFPFFEGFEAGNTQGSTDINQWNQIVGGQYDTQRWTANSTYTNYGRTPRSGNWNTTLRYNGESTLYRPIMLEGGEEYSLEFWARQDTNTGATIKAMLSDDVDFGSNVIEIVPSSPVISGDYQQFYGEFIAPASGTYYLGIYGNVTYNPWYISLDDITVALINPPEELVPPSNLQASVDGMNISLSWNAPGDDPIDPTDPQWITWCDVNEIGNAIGTGEEITFDVAHRYDADDLADFQDMALTKMKFVPNQADCIYTIKIWTGTNASAPGQLVYSQTVPSPTIGAWNEVILHSAIPIPATGELWIGYEVDTQTGYPAGVDAGPHVAGKGNMMYFNNQWIQLTDANDALTYNWSIQGFVDNVTPPAQALALGVIYEKPRELVLGAEFGALHNVISKTAESIKRSATRALNGYKIYRDSSLLATINNPQTLEYLDEVAAAGVYSYTVTAIYDGGESLPAGPVEVEVINPTAPIFAITPSSHDFANVTIGQSVSQEFTISNAGDGTLIIEDISISSAMMSLGTLPALPASLEEGETLQFSAIYTPTATGTHTGTISISDNLSPVAHTVALSGVGIGDAELYPPTNLQANVMGMDVTLSWDMPITGEWITWCNPDDISNSIGTDNSVVFDVAHRFDANDLSPYQGSVITRLGFVPNETNCTYTIKLWTGTDPAAPSALVHSQVVISPVIGAWNDVMLTALVPIPASGELWMGYEVDTQTGRPAGCDDGPPVAGKGNMMYFNNEWIKITDVSPHLTYNWSIMGYVDYYPRALVHADQPALSKPLVDTNNSKATLSFAELSLNRNNAITPKTPSETRARTGYNIYRNEVYIGSVDEGEDLVYVDTLTDFGAYSYRVTALYDEGESDPEGPVDVIVAPLEAPTNLGYTMSQDSVTLNWRRPSPPLEGDWISWSYNYEFENIIGTGDATTFEVAHRFDVNDLSSFVGGRVSKVTIVPGYEHCTYTIKVWRDGNADNPGNLLSSQILDTPHVGFWNTVILQNQVEILPDQELWIGYHVDTQGGYPAGCDGGPPFEGKGNLINMDGWTTLDAINEDFTYNWLIQAYVDLSIDFKKVESPILADTQSTSPISALSLAQVSPQRDRSIELLGYNIYRDNQLIGSINDPAITTFTQHSVPNGVYEYGVTAIYSVGESNPVTVEVTVDLEPAEAVFEDGFEAHPDFATQFEPWTLRDLDLSLTRGFSGIDFPGSETAFAYMIFNPSQTLPPITGLEPYEGGKMAAAFAAVNPPNDDWLISPRIQLSHRSAVRFFARSHNDAHGLERFKVAVSTMPSANIMPGYAYISGDNYIETPANWTEYYFDISDYDDQPVFIAIRCVSDDAFVFYVDNFTVYTGNTVSTDEDSVPAAITQLNGNYPNPFNPETNISFTMKEAGLVSLDIYNLKGQLVKSLVKGEMPSGEHTIVWNGRDNSDREVASGVYFLKMNTNNYSTSRKMIMMK